jgi:hypothetical protein
VGLHLRPTDYFREGQLSHLARFRHVIRAVDSRLVDWSDELHQRLDLIETRIGGLPRGHIDGATDAAQAVATPSPADLNVVGIDGKFIAFVTNPQVIQAQSVKIARARFQHGMNLVSTALLHNLQSATDLNFDQSSGLKDYGTSSQLMWTDQDPNATRFFRLRSSYDGKTWNSWQVYSSPLTCGPVGVWSGVLRSAALGQVNTSATPTSKPLSASTGVGVNDATINVAPFQVQWPNSISPSTDGLVSYSLGAITGLLDSTLYLVYCTDPQYSGGNKTYLAAIDDSDMSKLDALVFLGNITTPAHGGGNTTGGGGGNGPPGGACFSGNTRIITRYGIKDINLVIEKLDEGLTQRGWRVIRKLLIHPYSGPMRDLGGAELVTPGHRFWWHPGWVRAEHIFRKEVEHHSGLVFNLEMEGDGSDEEQCFTLANGWIAHNFQKR